MHPDKELRLEQAYNDANNYLSELEILLDKVGRLDDVFETDLIDNRMHPGAYQHIKHASILINLYMQEIYNSTRGVIDE
jgi:hypothetical protein